MKTELQCAWEDHAYEEPVIRGLGCQTDPNHEWAMAYLAGFFDGEGTVGIFEMHGSYVLQMSAVQIDPAPLDLFSTYFGGKVYRNERPPRAIYRWSVAGTRAAHALVHMLPYLYVKQEQASLAVAFQRTLKDSQHRAVVAERRPKQARYAALLRALKHVDFTPDGRPIQDLTSLRNAAA